MSIINRSFRSQNDKRSVDIQVFMYFSSVSSLRERQFSFPEVGALYIQGSNLEGNSRVRAEESGSWFDCAAKLGFLIPTIQKIHKKS